MRPTFYAFLTRFRKYLYDVANDARIFNFLAISRKRLAFGFRNGLLEPTKYPTVSAPQNPEVPTEALGRDLVPSGSVPARPGTDLGNRAIAGQGDHPSDQRDFPAFARSPVRVPLPSLAHNNLNH
jgi:hypothetical protein